jgi:hypothetical protein
LRHARQLGANIFLAADAVGKSQEVVRGNRIESDADLGGERLDAGKKVSS